MSDSATGTETAPTATATATAAHPRFAEALAALGLSVEIRKFPEATRTAAEAAAAIGCDLAQIVKSLVFAADGAPVLVLMDGASRVDVERVRAELGAAKVTRADAAVVRETTGYAIGGVPPFGHRTRTPVLADRGLLAHGTVWAAAGTPHTVFPLDPRTLIAHAGGRVVDVREQTS
ncbi:aminoacyl-tRNA deacylase [Streptomyces sp. NRRL F-4489]|uniref:YbaK/EbsC family protein n=1 Tax=Streptomyces sp. NRRL F-4489 TaxID=1609095 RepID=UPI00074A1958|nr:YbaK/EbsC family protein [Streptomyces sp. NRRL F-4489]KUL49760.1 aminoacyl-tRNA deacylase [Streptomyces sp. NRRL F-4489]